MWQKTFEKDYYDIATVLHIFTILYYIRFKSFWLLHLFKAMQTYEECKKKNYYFSSFYLKSIAKKTMTFKDINLYMFLLLFSFLRSWKKIDFGNFLKIIEYKSGIRRSLNDCRNFRA